MLTEKGFTPGATILKFRSPSTLHSRRVVQSAAVVSKRSSSRRETFPPRPDGDRIASCECGRHRAS